LKIRFLLPARRELHNAVRYYNAQRERLGEEFRDEAWETIQRINNFPLAWHPLGGSIRRCQMQRFPYGIIYEASELEIVIIAVAHLHQEPEYWRSRVQ
jgi:plasmid stabilization system protein ParE